MTEDTRLVRLLDELTNQDRELVGGKAAGLGGLRHALSGSGALLPSGFAVTASAYRMHIEQPRVARPFAEALASLRSGVSSATEAAEAIRAAIVAVPLPPAVATAITRMYHKLGHDLAVSAPPVAVRSSATTEDMPGASFAGQHSSFLGVVGDQSLLDACRTCFASLFTERAMAYRESFGFAHDASALAVVVHSMLAWPETEASGVIFTAETESGFPGVILISGTWGIGEAVVQGTVTPDEFLVFKHALGVFSDPILVHRRGTKLKKVVPGARPGTTRVVRTSPGERKALCLTDEDVVQLATWARQVDDHFGCAMDIEWVKDRHTRRLGVVQARPETVHAMEGPGGLASYRLLEHGDAISDGTSVGSGIATGAARVVRNAASAEFVTGEVLVAAATSPDWLPLMRRAAAIVTDTGGRTSHAAIVSRELGIPAVVGTGHATASIPNGEPVTVSCAEGREGHVYLGYLPYEVASGTIDDIPQTTTRVLMNIGIPGAAFRWSRLPVEGVGLARIEFIISEDIGAHPMALLHPERLDERTRRQVDRLIEGYQDGAAYFVERLSEGIAQIAAAQYPRPVVVRLSDFKSNEYANLLGGTLFELTEANPMLGLRGASRYHHERYREAFALECAAMKRVREAMGLDNVIVMIPFCRTVAECDSVLEEMAANGLRRGENGLKVWLMAEIPSNVVLAREFARRIDGFSIGSNDLTQLVLGVDRDSAELRAIFRETDAAVRSMIRSLIEQAHEMNVTVSICGQAPSDDPEFTAFLVECGIDSISVNPDAFLTVKQAIARAESSAKS